MWDSHNSHGGPLMIREEKKKMGQKKKGEMNGSDESYELCKKV